MLERWKDGLVKEMRLAGIDTIADANWYLEARFLPQWEERFTVAPRRPLDAHRPLGRQHRLEEILSVRVLRTVAEDHTVKWQGERWGVPRAEVCAGLRGARAEIEPPRAVSPSGLRPPGLAARSKPKSKTPCKPKYIPPPDHPWRTFLLGRKPDISTLR